MITRPTKYFFTTKRLSVTQPVTEIYRGPDPRRRKFLMALAAGLIAGQTFADTVYQDANPLIVDAKPPVLRTVTADPPVITVSNRRLVPITLTVSATDDVDWTPSCQVESVESNQPSLTSAGEDWTIMGPLLVYVRAERPTASGNREYTIKVQCADRTGKTSNVSQVKVPVAPPARRG
ncbi:MAG: hypothetical protein HYS05_02750 [Acidobacteria bacterium]|nr:hypothetical protein [Acidobacteriota bacterium]